MGSMGGNSEPVQFAFTEATQLSTALRSAATELESQASQRSSWATDALVDWKGTYAENFRADSGVAQRNAHEFVAALRAAATTLDGLATAAREERTRRNAALAWQAEQDSETWVEKAYEWATGTDEKIPTTTPQPGASPVISAPTDSPRTL